MGNLRCFCLKPEIGMNNPNPHHLKEHTTKMDIHCEKMVNNSEIKDFLEIHPKQSFTQEQNQGNK